MNRITRNNKFLNSTRLSRTIALFLPLVLWHVTATAAEVSVEFVHPEKYTDAADNDTNSKESVERNLVKLRKYFDELGKRYLKDGQALSIRVLDIDLAGQYEPWRHNDDHERYYRETTWPKIVLVYTLSPPDQPTVSHMETIRDTEYRILPNPLPQSDNLRYEKKMLDDWFRNTLMGKMQKSK